MDFDPTTAQPDKDPDADSLEQWIKQSSPGVKAADRADAAAGIVAAFKGGHGSEDALREVLRHSAKVLPAQVRKGIRREWYRTQSSAKKGAPSVDEFFAQQGPSILNAKFTGRGSWRDQAKKWISAAADHVHRTAGIRADAPVMQGISTTLKGS